MDSNLQDTLVQNAQDYEQSRSRSRQQTTPPAQVPGYNLIHCLGEGAYGSVWLAEELNTGKKVAIKYYTNRRGLDWSLLSREVEKLATLYTSRNIVGLLEVGWESEPPYYVMEYLEQGSLESLLAEGPLSATDALRISKSVLLALVHAHGRGILHCDLKPANVLLDNDFEPRLCDFGQSRLTDEISPALGTMFYMAPEQADLNAVPDARWDVYALGALFYTMLVGSPPHQSAENDKQIRKARNLEEQLTIYRKIIRQQPRPSEHRKATGLDKRMCEIIDRCLHPDPEKRFANPQVVLDLIEQHERQRTRKPLVALGLLGPGLLFLAMAPIFGNAMHSAVDTAREISTDRSLESNSLSARLLARSLERELDDRRRELMEIAEDPRLRTLILEATANQWEEDKIQPLWEYLAAQKSRVDSVRQGVGRPTDTSWFINDVQGYQRWREPFNEYTVGRRWAHRDYFHGLNKEFPRNAVPEDIQPTRKPHISQAFRSQATFRYMVAISVPIWDERKENVIGLLARTSHLGELLNEYEQRLHLDSGTDADRVIALVDSRDGKLLNHPWMTRENLKDLPDETIDKLALDSSDVERLQQLAALNGDATQTGHLDRNELYDDPVGTVARDAYQEKWLAAFAPIGKTSWVAIVQERRARTWHPVEEMRTGLMNYGIWAVLVAFALIGLMWFFVLRALNDRFFRNWSTRGGPYRRSAI